MRKKKGPHRPITLHRTSPVTHQHDTRICVHALSNTGTAIRRHLPLSHLPPLPHHSHNSQIKKIAKIPKHAHSTRVVMLRGCKKNHQAGHGSCDPTKLRHHAPYGPSNPSLKVETHPQNCRPAIWNLNLKTFAWREPRALECEAPSQPTP